MGPSDLRRPQGPLELLLKPLYDLLEQQASTSNSFVVSSFFRSSKFCSFLNISESLRQNMQSNYKNQKPRKRHRKQLLSKMDLARFFYLLILQIELLTKRLAIKIGLFPISSFQKSPKVGKYSSRLSGHVVKGQNERYTPIKITLARSPVVMYRK